MKRALMLNILVASLALVGAWVSRGIYDHHLLDAGVFHVVNACEDEHAVELLFPSGESRSADLLPGQAIEFQVSNTGEGAVTLRSDGEEVASIGYVTSHNSLAVVVLKPQGALFSQIVRK